MQTTKKAIFQNVHRSDWGDWQSGVTVQQFDEVLQLQGSKTPVQVLGVGCEVDGQFEHDYHNVQLPDGTVLNGLSGYNLSLLP